MPNILYLATGVFDKGGISRYSRYQISALRELVGDSCLRVLSLHGPGPNDFEEPFLVDCHGAGVGRMSKLRFGWNAFRRSIAGRPDVIWSNHLNLLPLAFSARLMARPARLVANVYGLELWSGGRRFRKGLLGRADGVVSDCHFSARYVVENFCVRPQGLDVIWDCVDTKRFSPRQRREDLLRKWGIPAGPQYKYVMTLGRIQEASRHKGYDRLLDVMGKFRTAPHVVALFVGDGDDRGRLERRGPGRGEGVPLVLLEAAACGKPIIAGDEDGAQEAVADGENGYIVSPRDPDALKKAIGNLLSNEDLRGRMGMAARRRVEREFSYEMFREKTGQCLERILAMSHRG